jgi:hypothetical protein
VATGFGAFAGFGFVASGFAAAKEVRAEAIIRRKRATPAK